MINMVYFVDSYAKWAVILLTFSLGAAAGSDTSENYKGKKFFIADILLSTNENWHLQQEQC